MISTRASKLSALAISTICWSAIDRPRTGRSGSRLHAEPVEQALHLPCASRARSMRFSRVERVVAHDDVLRDAQVGEQRRLLVDHRDARVARVVRRVEVDRLAVDEHLAGVATDDAAEHLHERRLAGAVLADQRAHLARAQREVAVAQRVDGAVGLADVAQLDDRRSRRRLLVVTSPPPPDSDQNRSKQRLGCQRSRIAQRSSGRTILRRSGSKLIDSLKRASDLVRFARQVGGPRQTRTAIAQKRSTGGICSRRRGGARSPSVCEPRLGDGRRARGAFRRVAHDRAPRPRRARAPRPRTPDARRRGAADISAHEDSFARRMKVETEAKRRLAEEAVAMLAPRETSSSTRRRRATSWRAS